MKKDIILAGVGGQGILSIATVIGEAALTNGLHIKQAEVHGMSQRGGSVVTNVKYSDKVYSPIVDKGEADIILAFEMLEAYRALPYLKIGGHIIANTQEINPIPVITGAATYPKDIDKKLSKVANTTFVDAASLAKEAGNIKAVNVVLLGVMAKKMDIAYDKWIEVIKSTVPAKLLDVNLKAFELGYNSK